MAVAQVILNRVSDHRYPDSKHLVYPSQCCRYLATSGNQTIIEPCPRFAHR